MVRNYLMKEFHKRNAPVSQLVNGSWTVCLLTPLGYSLAWSPGSQPRLYIRITWNFKKLMLWGHPRTINLESLRWVSW